MSRDKQTEIDELAKAIFLNCNCGFFEDEAEMIAKFCYQEIDKKASEVALELIGKIKEATENHIKAISRLEPQNDYCAGGKKALEMTLKVLAELKKKYIGKDTNVPTNTEET